MLDEINFPFLNFNDAAVEVSEWITISISHFTGHVLNYHAGIKVLRLRDALQDMGRSNGMHGFISYNNP